MFVRKNYIYMYLKAFFNRDQQQDLLMFIENVRFWIWKIMQSDESKKQSTGKRSCIGTDMANRTRLLCDEYYLWECFYEKN